jgi:tRNA threonylcarbamoyladenosine biosynthesis protein TsaE
MTKTWKTNSAEETIQCGRDIGKALRPGARLGLVGDLGSGKTVLVKGIALGLGVRDRNEVRSPTFVILHVYDGKVPLHHVDLYRLEPNVDLTEIGLDDYLTDPEAIAVVEWADRVPNILAGSDVRIDLAITGETKREIRMNTGAR